MQLQELIPAETFCSYYQIEYSFIDELQKNGLIEVIVTDKKTFIHEQELPKLEQLLRLHFDLEINIEGIDAIAHLLERVKTLQNELHQIKNKLRLYEEIN